MNIAKGIIVLFLMVSFSCKNDSETNKSPITENKETIEVGETNEKQNQAEPTHAHDGHDHSDHDGHSHGNEVKAIENGSRVEVPIKRNSSKNQPIVPQEIKPPSTTPLNSSNVTSQKMQSSNVKLPDPCSLMNEKLIADVVGVNEGLISLKDGSNPASPFAKSCFYRWEHQGVPNSGVMVQVQVNPVPNEMDNWAAYYIQAKKNGGEKTPDGSMTFKYSALNDLGIEGAYNYDLHRYLWRDKNDYLYMIAFNLPASEAEEVAWAKKLGVQVMKNAKF